ncbi:MAG: 50S ribosomal protein L5 [Candidatus Latescibacteria bacterium ADurb.Bin168]|nr:MAG: 50S ribosomal protein L5 [Candidatus Latescibacteria bacterium ADurb.Bin168]
MANEETKKKAAKAEAGADAKGATKKKAPKEQAAAEAAPKGKKATGAKSQEPKAAEPKAQAVPPRLRERYKAEIVPQLTKRFSYKNPMQVPRVLKVVVNMGVGEAIQNPKAVDSAVADLQQIAGQKPSVRRARKSVSNFKLRAGVAVGCAVTLRGVRMWEFLDRLMTFAIPRIRDFRGIPRRGFDGRGNFTFGVKEQLIFPEIDYDTVDQIRGMDISIVTTARTDEEAFELLSGLGMPFARQA